MAQIVKVQGGYKIDLRMNGKRLRRIYRTRPQAQAAMEDYKALRRARRFGEVPKEITWAFFKMRYLEYSKTTKTEQTHYRDLHSFKMLESVFPIYRLNQVNPDLLESLKSKLVEKGFHKPAINRCLSALKAAMRKAEIWKYIINQDWRSVSMLKTPQGRLIFYSVEELARLKARCKGVWLTGFMLGYEAGLRPMEKLNLQIQDIHWNLSKLHIHNSKGGKSRWVPMNARLKSYLQSLLMGRIYVLGDDKPNPDVWSSYWRKLIKSVHLKGSEYTLRHTFASHLAMAGVPLIKIKELMGHEGIKTTEIYSHLSPESIESSVNMLPKPSVRLVSASN